MQKAVTCQLPTAFRRLSMLRLYLRLISISLRSQMQYRLSFLLDALGSTFASLVEFVTLAAALTRFGSVGGWRLGEVAFLYGAGSIFYILSFYGNQPDGCAHPRRRIHECSAEHLRDIRGHAGDELEPALHFIWLGLLAFLDLGLDLLDSLFQFLLFVLVLAGKLINPLDNLLEQLMQFCGVHRASCQRSVIAADNISPRSAATRRINVDPPALAKADIASNG